MTHLSALNCIASTGAALLLSPEPGYAQNLYIANDTGSGNVKVYNAATGAIVNSSFINGLAFPYGLAVAANNLFVAYGGNADSSIGQYNATSGSATNTSFITGLNDPYELTIVGNNSICGR